MRVGFIGYQRNANDNRLNHLSANYFERLHQTTIHPEICKIRLRFENDKFGLTLDFSDTPEENYRTNAKLLHTDAAIVAAVPLFLHTLDLFSIAIEISTINYKQKLLSGQKPVSLKL